MDDNIKKKLKNIFWERLDLLCKETKIETGHTPQRLSNILNEVDNRNWFGQIQRLVSENVDDPNKIEGIEYLYNWENWDLSRFDLTIEAVIVENQDYRALFTEKEIADCKEKLNKLRYKIRTLD